MCQTVAGPHSDHWPMMSSRKKAGKPTNVSMIT